jgi:transposase
VRRSAAATRAASLVGGRTTTIPDRACFAAIVFMARTSTPWRLLPAAELGCGSYSTVRRRLDQWLAVGGIRPRIARRGVESSQRLGRYRWQVERSLSWLSGWRRLQVRWDRDSRRFLAFALLACAIVCFNRL